MATDGNGAIAQAFQHYPQQVRSSLEHPDVMYVRSPNYYAVHYSDEMRTRTTAPPNAVAMLEDNTIGIFEGTPPQGRSPSSGTNISPVYELQPSGSVAVPTGHVFIRFAEGVDASAYTDQIRDAGYEIAESPPYGTHAAWLRARSGKIADALAGVDNLQNLPDVQNVEPQMLMHRSLK